MRLLFLVLLLLASCDLPTSFGAEIPSGAVPMDPVPEVYSKWWRDVMRDAGIQRDVSHVRWFTVRGGMFWSERDGAMSAGRWIPDGRIYIAEGWELNEPTVKHEMLHELLQGDSNHEHPLFAHYRSCHEGGEPVSCEPR